MLPDNEVLSQVLEALYEVPLDPSRWEEFLKLTEKAAGEDARAEREPGLLPFSALTSLHFLIFRNAHTELGILRQHEGRMRQPARL
jgi:hypothetical protein